ncbi:hypothetical protein QUF70_05780 [Desulfobacterales bacterium HSG17]|nr:hypothetical protein [Desulfobacterales bacterium HSG17]
MKTGIIVYVVGSNSSDSNFNEKLAVTNLGIKADQVEFVFSGEACFDIADAWYSMIRKGMGRVVCMAGELINSSYVKLTGREMQLCAY